MEIKINCIYDNFVNPKDLKVHPLNRNKHGKEQIERLASLYKFHGVRHPIIVSKLSGCIVSGHARREAAIKSKMKAFPVVYQDFESEEQEYSFIQSDNAIALWSELDLDGIKNDLEAFNFSLDFNMLGIEDFDIKPDDAGPPSKEDVDLYTKKVKSPIYEPRGESPEIKSLFDTKKATDLTKRIEAADIPKDIAAFLKHAAARHVVFNYENIADYYAHAPKEVQELMEDSALVIIDFKKAIEHGFVKLTSEISDQYDEQE